MKNKSHRRSSKSAARDIRGAKAREEMREKGYIQTRELAEYRFLDRYSVNVQGEYRDAGESDNLGLRLGQAFLDGNFLLREDMILGANLGRIEVPFALYNRTRDRVDTRSSISTLSLRRWV
jgi:hypothetical protein